MEEIYGYHYTLHDHGRLETTALILVALAFPDGKGDAALEARLDEVCAVVVRRLARNKAWADELQLLRPRHAIVSDKRVAWASRQLQKALPKCLDAGWMALPFVRKIIVGPDAPLPGRLKKLTANAMAEAVAQRTGATPENVKTRIWRRSAPVLHLCVAHAALEINGSIGRDPNDLIDFLTESEDNLFSFLHTAEALEEAIVSERKLPTTRARIVPIRLTDF